CRAWLKARGSRRSSRGFRSWRECAPCASATMAKGARHALSSRSRGCRLPCPRHLPDAASGKIIPQDTAVDRLQLMDLRDFDPLVHLVHGLADKAELHHRAMILH